MTVGRIVRLHVAVPVTFIGAKDRTELEAIVDTGFTGSLSLPQALIDELDLAPIGTVEVELADSTDVSLPSYRATIEWQGYLVDLDVIATGDRPLLGLELLAGWELRAHF